MKLISIASACRLLGVSPKTMGDLIDAGEIGTVRVSPHRVKVDATQIADWASRGGLTLQSLIDRAEAEAGAMRRRQPSDSGQTPVSETGCVLESNSALK